jgi:hypothetical protein
MKKTFPIVNFISAAILFTTGCKKDVPTSTLEYQTYIHTYTASGNQTSWFIKPTSDNGCLFIGTEDEIGNLVILRINEKGQLTSKDTLKGFDVLAPVFTELEDGSFLICSGYNNSNLCKLDKNGKVIFITNFSGTGKSNSYPVVLKNGSYAIASAYGWGPGSYSLINFINPNGSMGGEVQITDASFAPKFKTLYTSLHKCDTIGTYYFNGFGFPNWNFSFRNRPKLFIAKQIYNGNTLVYNKFKIIDSSNINYSLSGVYQVNTKDKHTILAATFANINNLNKGKIIKLDEDLNSVWERDLLIGYATYCLGVVECPDGNYLISGVCWANEKLINQPFACKMDKNGNILWKNVFSTKLNAQFAWADQAKDGTCYFGGNTNGFGQANNLNDMFILKTDNEGNLK